MEKNKCLKPLNRKSEFDFLRKSARSFSHQWLKVYFCKKPENIKVAFSISKRYVFQAVVRNRLKRWGRDNLKKSKLRGWFLMVFLKKDKAFYKKLGRRDFDYVFQSVLGKIQQRS